MTAPDLDLAALRKAAEAATPGPWRHPDHGSVFAADSEQPDGTHVAVARCGDEWVPSGGLMCWRQAKANAVHIAAFDPPTCLALLDRLDAAERELTQLRASSDAVAAENEALRAALRPFAERARDLDDDHSDGEPFTAHAGAFRDAARALGEGR